MKDKIIGYSICLLSIVTLLGWGFFTILGIINFGTTNPQLFEIPERVTLALICAPILLGLIIVLGIAAWIGWTMARTPPPAPIDLEDFETLDESEGTDSSETNDETEK
ncbi:MAG: hypothetical protein GF308_13805 [Candidatus Heimdallarchaeota archaeon]|nr:hypothetical protein [Candidatus Heimdallarchaeota archaeon]